MRDEYIHPWDTPKSDICPDDLVSTHPRQAFFGLEIGLANQRAYCLRCDRQMDEGDEIYVYAYRPAEALEWCLARCYCHKCSPAGIETATLGTSEALITATLGVLSRVEDQLHHLCLTDIEVVDSRLPEEGTEP